MLLGKRRTQRDVGSSQTVATDHSSEAFEGHTLHSSGLPIPIGAGEQSVQNPLYSQSGSSKKARVLDPLTEFDEYGTELHRDARVWKAYVRETDKNDVELVKGWNDSTDVILIFVSTEHKSAALFSAISAAFLVESSKMLREDPIDVSTQTLLVISETLLVLANGTQSSQHMALPTSDSTGFHPSRTAICVNTLWYLSLSLSLATSFIAILAKDWSRSFMMGRTGHPFSQTFRRQQKWDMIERWKLTELLEVLPSLIHLALFLFSIGLCIYLWDTHIIVALPVICLSVVSMSFYIFSSLAAIVLDFFPYPTIISRLCRTEFVKEATHLLVRKLYTFAWFVLQVSSATGLILGYLVLFPIHLVILALDSSFARVGRILGPLNFSGEFVVFRHVQFGLHALPRALISSLRFAVWYPVHNVHKGILAVHKSVDETTVWLLTHLSSLRWHPHGAAWTPKSSWREGNISSEHGRVTGLALSWLIKNCEVPQSVDIALQSIAGASKNLFRTPLQECDATREILRRLASSDIYTGSNTETIVTLYSRALSFLSSSQDLRTSTSDDIRGDLEVMVWDLQALIESNVASLITHGQFKPSAHNISALRIGNTAASLSLQLIGNSPGRARTVFDSMIHLLDRHIQSDDHLHPSALLSLVNAAALLSLFDYDPAAASSLSGICITLTQYEEYSRMPKLKLALIACTLLHSITLRQEGPWQPVYVESALRTLIELQSPNKQALEAAFESGCQRLSYFIGSSRFESLSYTVVKACINTHVASLVHGLEDPNVDVLVHIQAILSAASLAQVSDLPPRVYVLVLVTICHYSSVHVQCGQLISKIPFPKLSCDLVESIRELSVVKKLLPPREQDSVSSSTQMNIGGTGRAGWMQRMRRTRDSVLQKSPKSTKSDNHAVVFFQTGQLWLLFALCDLSSKSAEHVDALQTELESYRPDGLAPEESRLGYLGEQLQSVWDSSNQEIVATLGVYAYRLIECVLQLQNRWIPQQIRDGLRHVPPELRGLSSFTDWQPRSGYMLSSEDRVEGTQNFKQQTAKDVIIQTAGDLCRVHVASDNTCIQVATREGRGSVALGRKATLIGIPIAESWRGADNETDETEEEEQELQIIRVEQGLGA